WVELARDDDDIEALGGGLRSDGRFQRFEKRVRLREQRHADHLAVAGGLRRAARAGAAAAAAAAARDRRSQRDSRQKAKQRAHFCPLPSAFCPLPSAFSPTGFSTGAGPFDGKSGRYSAPAGVTEFASSTTLIAKMRTRLLLGSVISRVPAGKSKPYLKTYAETYGSFPFGSWRCVAIQATSSRFTN